MWGRVVYDDTDASNSFHSRCVKRELKIRTGMLVSCIHIFLFTVIFSCPLPYLLRTGNATPRRSRYVARMAAVREACRREGTVPLYHYTMKAIAPFIQRGGFRMSTQGQGDGGVYFSTLGPSSYALCAPLPVPPFRGHVLLGVRAVSVSCLPSNTRWCVCCAG